jgi:hypothetical protein
LVEGLTACRGFLGKGLGKSGSVGGLPENSGMADEKPQVEKRSVGLALAQAAVAGGAGGAVNAYVSSKLSKPKPEDPKKS